MIEQLIQNLIAALNANTAAHGGTAATNSAAVAAETAGAATETKTAATGKATAGKGKGAAAAPKGPKREEVVALLTKIKDEQGTAQAKAVIEGAVGAGVKMAEIPDASLKAVFDAATAALAGEEDPEEDGGDL